LCSQSPPDIPLPSGWDRNVKSAVLHAIALAQYAIVAARGWAANSIDARVRPAADNHRFEQKAQLLREELRIRDARMAKIDPRRRPYYPPAERMAIIELKAARASAGFVGFAPCVRRWNWRELRKVTIRWRQSTRRKSLVQIQYGPFSRVHRLHPAVRARQRRSWLLRLLLCEAAFRSPRHLAPDAASHSLDLHRADRGCFAALRSPRHPAPGAASPFSKCRVPRRGPRKSLTHPRDEEKLSLDAPGRSWDVCHGEVSVK